jgi:hypothetical protein
VATALTKNSALTRNAQTANSLAVIIVAFQCLKCAMVQTTAKTKRRLTNQSNNVRITLLVPKATSNVVRLTSAWNLTGNVTAMTIAETDLTKKKKFARKDPVQAIHSDVIITVVYQEVGIAMEMTIAAMELTNLNNTVRQNRGLALEIYTHATMAIASKECTFATEMTIAWTIRTKMNAINAKVAVVILKPNSHARRTKHWADPCVYHCLMYAMVKQTASMVLMKTRHYQTVRNHNHAPLINSNALTDVAYSKAGDAITPMIVWMVQTKLRAVHTVVVTRLSSLARISNVFELVTDAMGIMIAATEVTRRIAKV